MIEPAEVLQPAFLPEAQEAEPKRRRRRKAATVEAATVTLDAPSAEAPKAPKPRARAKKLTADHVTQGVVKFGELAAITTGFEGWQVPAAEVKPWAGEAAELLNSIPAQYVSGVLRVSSVAVVVYGMYMTFVPRMAMYQAVKAAEKHAARGAATTVQAEHVMSAPAESAEWGN